MLYIFYHNKEITIKISMKIIKKFTFFVVSIQKFGVYFTCIVQITFFCLFVFVFVIESYCVPQAGVQWCNLGSLQPLLPGSSNSCVSAS